MFGAIKSFFGKANIDANEVREEFAKAKNDLEAIMMLTRADFGRKQEDAVAAALRLRETLSSGIALSSSEKIELVQLLNQVKVKSVSMGTSDSYRVFHIVDDVSGDIQKYL